MEIRQSDGLVLSGRTRSNRLGYIDMNELFEQQARDLAIMAASEGYSLKPILEPIVTVTLSENIEDQEALTTQALED